MNIVTCIAGLDERGGGPPQTALAQCRALLEHNVRARLLTIAPSSRGAPSCKDDRTGLQISAISGLHFPVLRLSLPIGYRRALRQEVRRSGAVLIQNHGLWTPLNHFTAVVARQLGMPLVCMVHGMLSPWALRHKRWKKRVAWWLYQRQDLRAAQALIATGRHEVEHIRAVGCRQPIALIPNGVRVPPWQDPKNGNRPRKVLFLGRIYPVKGLLNLVRAWGELGLVGWECLLAGPDESGHQRELEAEIGRLDLGGRIKFLGEVYGEAKWNLYRSADLFVLPSFSENFGNVVAEALSFGIPVITTKGTPWSELEKERCGWWIDIGVGPLVVALREATGETDNERRAMGRRGRALVEAKYTWKGIAGQLKAVYEWVLGHAPKPENIIL